MNKLINIILCFFIITCFTACELFEKDNYAQPSETIRGEVVDVVTGEKVLTDQGSEGTRIRLRELSWTQTPTPSNFDFWCMKEGIFQNTKVFKGHYNVRIDGAFVPLVRIDQKGDTISDESKYIDIAGTTEVSFKVQPFLRVEWVGEPTVANGKITARFKVTRGVSEADFKAKVQPMGGWNDNYLWINDVRLFVSQLPYVGYREWDNRYTTIKTFSDNSFAPSLGQTYELTTQGTIPAGRKVWVRVGARMNYRTEGNYRHNYNLAKEVDIPR